MVLINGTYVTGSAATTLIVTLVNLSSTTTKNCFGCCRSSLSPVTLYLWTGCGGSAPLSKKRGGIVRVMSPLSLVRALLFFAGVVFTLLGLHVLSSTCDAATIFCVNK